MDDVEDRIRDAALGELAPEELAQLERELDAHPDGAALRKSLAVHKSVLQTVAENPRLGNVEVSDAWREQTLHKAKVEAAKVRRDRDSRGLEVVKAEAVPRAQLIGPPPTVAPSSRMHLVLSLWFVLLLLCATVVTFGMLIFGDNNDRTPGSNHSPNNALGPPVRPVDNSSGDPVQGAEWDAFRVKHPQAGRAWKRTDQVWRIEFGGALTEPQWKTGTVTVMSGGKAFVQEDPCRDWVMMELEGDVRDLSLTYGSEPPVQAWIRLMPSKENASSWTVHVRGADGRERTQGLPPGHSSLQTLRLEKNRLPDGRERIQFKARGTATGSQWTTLGDLVLDVPMGAGRWQIELPADASRSMQFLMRVDVEDWKK